MSHYPFAVQMALGIARPQDTSRRVSNPNSSTPTSFDLNWDHSENGPSDPQPDENACTFMGPAVSEAAGNGHEEYLQDHVLALKTAVQLFRKEGYSFSVPEHYETKVELSEAEKELDFFKEEYYADMSIRNESAKPVAVLSLAQLVQSKFGDHFALTRDEHGQSELRNDNSCTISQRTGNGPGKTSPCIGTLFELKKAGKIVSKCICSYQNAEMDNTGPTIEVFETAAEWRNHGYGSKLFQEVQAHFENLFENAMDTRGVKFNVCYVTNYEACQWFQNRGFFDLDGMGEELGKVLGQ
ncbi:MAG: hypothetical protein SGARI_004510 [Bacillariaceae sp.]